MSSSCTSSITRRCDFAWLNVTRLATRTYRHDRHFHRIASVFPVSAAFHLQRPRFRAVARLRRGGFVAVPLRPAPGHTVAAVIGFPVDVDTAVNLHRKRQRAEFLDALAFGGTDHE